MVIMGGRYHTGIELLLPGSIEVMIAKAALPVLLVSAKKMAKPLNTVVFATNLISKDAKALKFLTQICNLLITNLVICHISLSQDVISDDKEKEVVADFMIEVKKLVFKRAYYINLIGKNIVDVLNKFNQSIHSDLLVIVHKKHSFLWKLLNKSNAKMLIQNQELPLLILPG